MRSERQPTDHHTTVNGVRLHHRRVGPRGAPVVVLLHGIMGHTREWDAVTEPLARHFDVVTVDQRGHGESAWTSDYRASAMAEDILALVDELGVGPVHLIGHSMGGMVSMLVAARRPELVEQLVVIDVGPGSLTGDFADELPLWLATLGDASYASVDDAVEEWSAGNPLVQPDHLRRYVEHCLVPRDDGRLVWRFDARGLVRFATSGVSADELWDAVDRIICPVLLVRGEHSPVLSPEQARQLSDRFAAGTLVEIAGGGHDLGVEQPEAIAEASLRFLRAGAPVPTP